MTVIIDLEFIYWTMAVLAVWAVVGMELHHARYRLTDQEKADLLKDSAKRRREVEEDMASADNP